MPLTSRPRALQPRHGAMAPRPLAGDMRIDALDGLRGMLAMMVLLAHYFGEVPHGISAFAFGWIGVHMFFVLSGFLMARIVLEYKDSPHFWSTFYVRRACRTLPVYLVLLLIVFSASALFGHTGWMQAEKILPLWSYLTFTQGFVMVATGDFGSTWLTPTWTLTVEEQFYLIAPVICVFTPRRKLLALLAAGLLLSISYRALVFGAGSLPDAAAMVLLPGVAYTMFAGMIAALLLMSPAIDWRRYDLGLRIVPILGLGVAMGLKIVGGTSGLFQAIGVPVVGLACAAYLASLVRNAPEAERMKSSGLRYLGRLSYSIYLLHMPVLGLMHGLVLAGTPDIATLPQIIVTIAAVPVAILLAHVVNRCVEAPMIAYGRTWTWHRTNDLRATVPA